MVNPPSSGLAVEGSGMADSLARTDQGAAMPTYAQKTQVSPERSRAEIEQTLKRLGADAFGYGYEGNRAVVSFRCQGRHIRFEVTTPSIDQFKRTKGGVWRTAVQQRAAQEQAIRQRWRALALLVKAKLEGVEAGIETFEIA